VTFKEELTQLINRHSKENGSNTPDFILSGYLFACLDAFDAASRQRERWYEVEHSPGTRADAAVSCPRCHRYCERCTGPATPPDSTQAGEKEGEDPPCGGSRCFRASRDGEWIHSSKSYGTCRVRAGEKEGA
jgi:hypothetical protein